ncbi:hypothetical protein [Neisseria polysaccharea]|uniref:hypothetical protein n=1 Tax=Neisseria polysaccharea TaxID=489 RepID=UPI002729D295|nr:hypothetical protein [Neisseria polysaccharea]
MPSERRQVIAAYSFGAFRQILCGIVVEKNGAGQVGTRQADGEYLFLKVLTLYIYIYILIKGCIDKPLNYRWMIK